MAAVYSSELCQLCRATACNMKTEILVKEVLKNLFK